MCSPDSSSSNSYLSNSSSVFEHQEDLSPSENRSNCVTPQVSFGNMASTPSPPHTSLPQLHNISNGDGQHGQHGAHKLGKVKSVDTCRVCADGPARPHYGVPTCFGCKGFFRRTLKRTKEYTCRYNGNCVVDRYERNSCRYCRFKRCLEVGMDPKAVRPDRDAAGRTHPIRHRRSRNSLGELAVLDEENSNASDDWIRKLPVDMRTLLMQIMNIELLLVQRGIYGVYAEMSLGRTPPVKRLKYRKADDRMKKQVVKAATNWQMVVHWQMVDRLDVEFD